MSKPTWEFKNILVPVDFSPPSIMLLKKAGKMAEELGARLEIIHVVESLAPYAGFAVPHLPLENLGRDLVGYAEKKMEKFLEENLQTSAPVQSRIISGTDAAAEIIRQAEESGSDLVLITTHGQKGLPKLIFGSVAERVLKQAPCPVMTFK